MMLNILPISCNKHHGTKAKHTIHSTTLRPLSQWIASIKRYQFDYASCLINKPLPKFSHLRRLQNILFQALVRAAINRAVSLSWISELWVNPHSNIIGLFKIIWVSSFLFLRWHIQREQIFLKLGSLESRSTSSTPGPIILATMPRESLISMHPTEWVLYFLVSNPYSLVNDRDFLAWEIVWCLWALSQYLQISRHTIPSRAQNDN